MLTFTSYDACALLLGGSFDVVIGAHLGVRSTTEDTLRIA